jgi:glycosyltransferase involved in cell wall biosynthesis
MRMGRPLVSVIVPTYNSGRTLGRCLESIMGQDYDNIEVLVVDRYSEDGTRRLAKSYGVNLLLRGPERSAQKNWGALNAKGELLYFVDSDFVLERDVISKCVEACMFFDALCTVNYSVGGSFWSDAIAFKERFLAHDPTIQVVRFLWKRVFFEVGGFDEALIVGEDLDLYARLLEGGYRIGRVDAVEWHIGEPKTLRDIARRNFYYGKVVRPYFRKRGRLAVRQLSPFKPSLILALIRSGNPCVLSLGVVDLTRWISSILGIFSSFLGEK